MRASVLHCGVCCRKHERGRQRICECARRGRKLTTVEERESVNACAVRTRLLWARLAERAALLRLTERTRLGQMFALVRATTQMLKGYCDVEGNRCTVGPKGFGTITIIDENDNGSIEYPMEYTWNSCLDEHHTKTGDPDYCGESCCSAC